MTTRRTVRIGARRSPLAVAQATWVAERLRAAGHEVEFVGITSQGDIDTRRLTEIGGTGVFAAAVRAALIDGIADVAVHSLKDLPVAPAAGLDLAAVPAREDARDVIVGLDPDQWTDQTVVGTGSPRREAQLRALAASRGIVPTFVPVRGNVDTRIDLVRSGQVSATVLAAAGLRRLGRLVDADPTHVGGVAARVLALDALVPAAGQGALGIECAADSWCHSIVAELDHAPTRAAVTAERSFLARLEAGCLAPVGAHATVEGAVVGGTDAELSLMAAAASDAGVNAVFREQIRGSASAAHQLGEQLAERVLVHLTGDADSSIREATPASNQRGASR